MNARANATILVIDDDLAIVDMLQMALEDEGYVVLTAPDGEAGLEQLAATQTHLVLCDVMMPGIDGREFCRIVAANPAYRDTPVVLMSAGRLEIDRRAFPHVAFLAKPFNFSTLLALVDRYTNDSSTTSLQTSSAT